MIHEMLDLRPLSGQRVFHAGEGGLRCFDEFIDPNGFFANLAGERVNALARGFGRHKQHL